MKVNYTNIIFNNSKKGIAPICCKINTGFINLFFKQLNVTKILSGRDLTAMSTDAVSFQRVAEDSDYTIFEVRYQQ